MGGICIVTDSAHDLPSELLAEHKIISVPLEVRLGETDPAELVNISAEHFWHLAAASPAVGETAAPSPGAFSEAFRSARQAGAEGVCCVTISSKLSATYQAACAGAAEVVDDIPIAVIDSQFATLGEGLLVLEASEQAALGKSLDDVAAAVTTAIPTISTFGTLDTLEYLRRGGRIGGAQALLGSLLSIKPIIEVREGVVEGESRQRTRSRSFRYLAEKVAAAGPLKRLAVVHAAAVDIEDFLELMRGFRPRCEMVVSYIGPVIGAHTGPGTIGVCFQRG